MVKGIKTAITIAALVVCSYLTPTSFAGSWNGWIYQDPYPTSYMLSAVNSSLLANQITKSTDSKNEDTAFQKLQTELNKEKNRKKVLERLEMAGLRGLTLDNISLNLLNYSFHETNDSGRPQAFITAQCHIDISLYEKQAAELRKREPRARILLPDSEKIVLGVFDDEKDELITFADYPVAMKPTIRFVKLRQNRPEHIILSAEQDADADGLMWQSAGLPVRQLRTAIIGYDTKNKAYFIVKEIEAYKYVAADGPDGSIAYIDTSEVTWSDWINNDYREVIVTTKRKILSRSGNAKAGFKERKEVYTWINDKELSLKERIDDGKRKISRGRQ